VPRLHNSTAESPTKDSYAKPKMLVRLCRQTRKRNQTQGEEHMKFVHHGELVDGLVEDLLNTIHKYDETLYMATVIGCLELVKQQLIDEAKEPNDD